MGDSLRECHVASMGEWRVDEAFEHRYLHKCAAKK